MLGGFPGLPKLKDTTTWLEVARPTINDDAEVCLQKSPRWARMAVRARVRRAKGLESMLKASALW